MATEHSNHYFYELHNADVDYGTHVFKLILMATGFSFNKDTHALYADISASELANGNGYTTGGQTLANVSVTEDDTHDRSYVSWDDATWTPSGGNIGPSPGAVIIDDTHASDLVVGYIDFGSDQTATPGGTFVVSAAVNLRHPTP